MISTKLLDQIIESSKELGVLEDRRDKLTESIKYNKERTCELNHYLRHAKPSSKKVVPFGWNSNHRNKVTPNRAVKGRVQEFRLLREMWRHERHMVAVQLRLDEQELQEVHERLATHEARISKLRTRAQN